MSEAILSAPITAILRRLFERYSGDSSGHVAGYIPELAEADPERFAISLTTVDGTTYSVGQTAEQFTIQSISKPLTYGLALDERGREEVRKHIGVEPTGEAFNSIALDPATGAALNPMVNAGAIAAVGLIADNQARPPEQRILDTFSRYAGRQLSVDERVLDSERRTGHRNRAIGHLLAGSGALSGDPHEVVERYFQQCSILVNCEDLSMIAATLASGGINPRTGARAASTESVRSVLSVMASCGMYDHAGEWLYSVGLPAKSGVAGGVIAVLPGRLGIGVFSPRLDDAGNSVRGVRVCQDLSDELELHLVRPSQQPPLAIRTETSLAQRRSKRLRDPEHWEVLKTAGARTGIYVLQGELDFTAAEQLLRAVSRKALDSVVLDFARVPHIAPPAAALIASLASDFKAAGGSLSISDIGDVEPFDGAEIQRFAELDAALESAENQLLIAAGASAEPAPVELAEHNLLIGLDAVAVERFRAASVRREFAPGELMLGRGEQGTSLLLILEGRASIFDAPSDDHPRRVATAQAGMLVGEVAFFTGDPRLGDVYADSHVVCKEISHEAIESLRDASPATVIRILQNLVRILSRHMRIVAEGNA